MMTILLRIKLKFSPDRHTKPWHMNILAIHSLEKKEIIAFSKYLPYVIIPFALWFLLMAFEDDENYD